LVATELSCPFLKAVRISSSLISIVGILNSWWPAVSASLYLMDWASACRDLGYVSATRSLLNRGISERSQDCVDSRLIASPLCLKPIKHILIHSQRNRCLGRQWLQTLANQASHNVPDVGLRVLWRWRHITSAGLQSSPISF
jgi:hypothetical protein